MAFSGSLGAQNLTVSVQTSLPSPQPIETPITLTLSAADTNVNPGILNYKIEVSAPGSTTFRTVHDFAEAATFVWGRNIVPGTYQIRVTARDSNYLTQPSATVVPFTMTTRLTGNQPVVNATSHPLVALFSAPSCPSGESMRVSFLASGSSAAPYTTNYSSCTGSGSMNFLVAGLIPSTKYVFTYQIKTATGSVTNGPSVSWTSGAINPSVVLAPVSFPVPYGQLSSQPERITLISNTVQATPDAVDTQGRVVWYYAGNGIDSEPGVPVVQITRLINGGTMLLLTGYDEDYTGTGVYGNQVDHQVVQEMDMTGAVVRETNVDRMNEQLIALGADPISTFNHEAIRLSNGDTVVVATVQKIFPAGTQGSTTPIDILGTTLVELDANFQLVWYWECFDHLSTTGLNINTPATLGEQCGTDRGTSEGCPPVLLSVPANDWLHTNTAQIQTDGSIVMSLRNLDSLIKIDFGNGSGTGNVLWTLGQNGNFALINSTNDPWPWFSHQHDAEIVDSLETLIIFDNGNTRVDAEGGNSRGYVMNLNESTMVATTLELYNMGYYAVAQGSAQKLSNGDYFFMGGQIAGAKQQFQYGAEFGILSGNIVYSEQTNKSEAYRAWRVPNLSNLPQF
jgi:hypothetical protein